MHLLSAEASSRRDTQGTIVTAPKDLRSGSQPSGMDVYAAMSGALPTAGPSRSRPTIVPEAGFL